MRVLLISTYELGHQPLHVASPAGALRAAGHDVACVDLSVQPWDAERIAWADAVAFSVPMHTAMRLAVSAATRVRRTRPDLPVCFYGLYAPVSRERTLGRLADHVVAGEYEPSLVAWADAVAGGGTPDLELVRLGRSPFTLPARDLLPPLERYARLEVAGQERLVGYVEATHGCRHTCRHCPLPTVYGGRIAVVPVDVLLDDIAVLVDAGAQHITFGDPDFLNAPAHARRVVAAVHDRFPALTFDVTCKVEHILAQERLWPEFARAGCLFVVSAFESVNDATLALLVKGHVTADAATAVALLRRWGIEIRPSWLPFTPWTTVQDVADILDFVAAHDLIANVDPVQYTIRLLLPEGSLLLERAELAPYLGAYDADALSYAWSAADPVTVALQRELLDIVHADTAAKRPPGATYLRIRAAVAAAAGTQAGARDLEAELEAQLEAQLEAGSVQGRPRLSEPWFC